MEKTREIELQTVGRRPSRWDAGPVWQVIGFPKAYQENRLVRYCSGTQWHSLVGTSELAFRKL